MLYSIFIKFFFINFSQTYKFYPTDDAFVNTNDWGNCLGWENENNGNKNHIRIDTWTYHELGCGTGMHRTFIKFDFNITDNNSKYLYDNRAVLKLFHYSQTHWYTGAASENELFICMPKEDWSETTITWNNQPNVFSENQIHVATGPTGETSIDYVINVSDFLRKWFCGENENYGMQIRLVTEEIIIEGCVLHQKENANSDLWPFIEAEYAKIEAPKTDSVCVGSVVKFELQPNKCC